MHREFVLFYPFVKANNPLAPAPFSLCTCVKYVRNLFNDVPRPSHLALRWPRYPNYLVDLVTLLTGDCRSRTPQTLRHFPLKSNWMINGCALLRLKPKRVYGLFFGVYSRHIPSLFHLKSHLPLYLPNSSDWAHFNSDGIFISSLHSSASLTHWSPRSHSDRPQELNAQLASEFLCFFPLSPASFHLETRKAPSGDLFLFVCFPGKFFHGDSHWTLSGNGRLWCAGDSPTRKRLTVLHKEPAEHWR